MQISSVDAANNLAFSEGTKIGSITEINGEVIAITEEGDERILDVYDENGVDVCYEIHPGEDLHDGITFERFLEATNNHKRVNILYDPSHFVLQQLDYLNHTCLQIF